MDHATQRVPRAKLGNIENLHIASFQFIEVLDGHRLQCWILNIAKYAQILV